MTAQNTLGVQSAMPVPTDFINEQFQSLADDFDIVACKTGMLFDKEHVLCVVNNLKRFDFGQLVGDPVMVAKGGHLDGTMASDWVLLESGELFFMSEPRVNTKNTHGTGDTFSACIVSELAKGLSMKEAIVLARQYVQGTIADGIAVGHGHGPLNHWADIDSTIKINYIKSDGGYASSLLM